MTRDLRKYARQTNARLLIGFSVILFGIGVGLIYLIWGGEAAVMASLCLFGALVPAALIWLVLTLMGWIVKKAQD